MRAIPRRFVLRPGLLLAGLVIAGALGAVTWSWQASVAANLECGMQQAGLQAQIELLLRQSDALDERLEAAKLDAANRQSAASEQEHARQVELARSAQLESRIADLELDLSEARRALVVVEKERDDARRAAAAVAPKGDDSDPSECNPAHGLAVLSPAPATSTTPREYHHLLQFHWTAFDLKFEYDSAQASPITPLKYGASAEIDAVVQAARKWTSEELQAQGDTLVDVIRPLGGLRRVDRRAGREYIVEILLRQNATGIETIRRMHLSRSLGPLVLSGQVVDYPIVSGSTDVVEVPPAPLTGKALIEARNKEAMARMQEKLAAEKQQQRDQQQARFQEAAARQRHLQPLQQDPLAQSPKTGRRPLALPSFDNQDQPGNGAMGVITRELPGNPPFVVDEATIHFIVPLAGRADQLDLLLHNILFLAKQDKNVALVLVDFLQGDHNKLESNVSIQRQLGELQALRYFRKVEVNETFSRARGLAIGTAHTVRSPVVRRQLGQIVHDQQPARPIASSFRQPPAPPSTDALAFFCDVDMEVQLGFLRQCRQNVVRGEQVFAPIVHSLFRNQASHITPDSGFWRYYGFGMMCTFASDFDAVGGFGTKQFDFWGHEDVHLVDTFLARGYRIFRAVSTPLYHRWHDKVCNSTVLSPESYTACQTTRGLHVGSNKELAGMVANYETRIPDLVGTIETLQASVSRLQRERGIVPD
ncbi:hypothetical protein CAOG_06690 [Capsaspora owczarzaki ATCC 30864]|uniref:Hexosyltransferase n=1 Tax=Capsaspora owczarzaki (strain ATCC 30864) TaxID=595528 RepID=A0A0D2VXG6_CAPO3|nr:hypothetical protein CAOG_06690 [Capsaspora owczarzaki ATCC 30864]KJE96352.1 hypothetical protein CAOG_006690 [Capsaspora owczarzaki ATCC 30864]|eukprot:XP_004344311.1 hypothetical protein CAOG_06690 [Capsaspora owczarzaki ATCC 30864]